MSGRLPLHVNQLNGVWGIDLRMALLPEKLNAAGYVSHQVGKWHCGAQTVGHLPVSRGFTSSLGYLGGETDHWTQAITYEFGAYVDLWDTDAPAYGQNGTYGGFMYARRAVEVIKVGLMLPP